MQSVFVFFVAPRWAPRPFGGARAKKKHHPGCVFFFCSGPERQGKEKPRWATARGQSKKTPCGPARTLTHSLRAWAAMPPAGVCFFFCCGPARTGVVFFVCCGPARTLTHALWAGAISASPGWYFFAAAPPNANNKKCLVYYIGSKNDPAGPQQKNNTTSRTKSIKVWYSKAQ